MKKNDQSWDLWDTIKVPTYTLCEFQKKAGGGAKGHLKK